MGTETIILIITNILVPIIIALIGLLSTRKYKKDIEMLKLEHKNELEKIEIQHNHQIDLMNQKTGMNITENIASKLFDEALNNPDIKRQFHEGVSSSTNKKRRR